jgi:hypothetical protein
MLFIIICCAALILVPTAAMMGATAIFVVHTERAETVVESAAKVAAMEITKVVVNDANFGLISLSNHAPSSATMIAADGQPLPVTSVYTLRETIRRNKSIGAVMHNNTLVALAESDEDILDKSIDTLNDKVEASLFNTTKVEKFITEHCPENLRLESLKVTSGWLEDDPLPDTRTHLVSNSKFRETDRRHICSAIKVECTFVSTHGQTEIRCSACAQAHSEPDNSPLGAMTLRYNGRPVAGLQNWNELLCDGSYRDNKVSSFDVIGGDYPFEREAKSLPSRSSTGPSSTAEQFAEHLYNWLKSAHARVRSDAILAMTQEPFLPDANRVYAYTIENNGTISRHVYDCSRFPRPVAAQGQEITIADTRIKSGANAIIHFRDSVKLLAPYATKHGGQPLVGYPLNEVDPSYNYEQLASSFSQRQSLKTGLALDIEIGGLRESTAHNDIRSMRERTMMRKI